MDRTTGRSGGEGSGVGVLEGRGEVGREGHALGGCRVLQVWWDMAGDVVETEGRW